MTMPTALRRAVSLCCALFALAGAAAPGFLQDVERLYARYRVPPGGLTLPEELGRAAEGFVAELLRRARGAGALAGARAESLEAADLQEALDAVLPREIAADGSVVFLPKLAAEERVEVPASDLASFRDSGMQRRLLGVMLDLERVEPGAPLDAASREILGEGLAQYSLLVFRKAGDLARAEGIAPFVSGRHLVRAAREIRRLAGLPEGEAAARPEALAEADRRYVEAFGLPPGDADAHAAYASEVAEVLSYGEAIEHFETALRLDPEHLDAHFGYASLLVRVKRNAEAVPHFEKLIGSGTPREAPAHTSLGMILAAMGRQQESLEHFEAAVRLSPDQAEARFNLGLACYHNGRFEDAVLHLSEAVKLDPKLARAHLRLGGALSALGRHREALAVYQTLLGLNHRDPVALYEIGVTFQVLENTGKARRAFQRALAQARKSYRYRDLQKRIEERLASL
jgi:tetratricopeptide (TPR) repeat protein